MHLHLGIAERNTRRRGSSTSWYLKRDEYARLNFTTASVSRLFEDYITASWHLHSSPLHIPPSSNHNRLPTNIAKQRTRDRQHRTRRLRRRPRPPQWDVHMFLALRSSILRLRYAQRDLFAVGCGDESALFLRCRQARLNVPKGYRICADAELGTPSGHTLEERVKNGIW
jgi:hypothetical protein